MTRARVRLRSARLVRGRGQAGDAAVTSGLARPKRRGGGAGGDRARARSTRRTTGTVVTPLQCTDGLRGLREDAGGCAQGASGSVQAGLVVLQRGRGVGEEATGAEQREPVAQSSRRQRSSSARSWCGAEGRAAQQLREQQR